MNLEKYFCFIYFQPALLIIQLCFQLFRYGRVDCIPSDPSLPYKAPKHENHPLFHGTGTESVDFMKKEFNMSAEEFTALIAVHASAQHGPGLITRYIWHSPTYLSNMFHKKIVSRPMYRYHLILNSQTHK